MSILNIFKSERTLLTVDAELTELRKQKDKIMSKLRETVAERDSLVARETALQKVSQMTTAERKALGLPEPQTVTRAGAIRSKESF